MEGVPHSDQRNLIQTCSLQEVHTLSDCCVVSHPFIRECFSSTGICAEDSEQLEAVWLHPLAATVCYHT